MSLQALTIILVSAVLWVRCVNLSLRTSVALTAVGYQKMALTGDVLLFLRKQMF